MSATDAAALTTPSPAWRSRIVGHGDVPPAELTPHEANWRRHPQAQVDALVGSLDQVGWVQQVIVSRRSGRIVDGHARVEQAIARGEATVPVVWVELDEHEERLVLATLDPITTLATTDDDALRALLETVAIDSETLDEAVRGLLAHQPTQGLTDPDDVPDEPAEVSIAAGEVWQLGAHRLACGDCRDPELVARLLDGAAPTLLVTDPPYGVRLDLSWRDEPGAAARSTTIAGDDIVDWSEAFALVPSLDVAYVWHAALHAAQVVTGLERIGFEIVSQVVWDKGLFAMGRSWYHWAHEVCWVARRGGRFLGGRDQATVWRIPQRNPDHDHPAICCQHQATVWRAPSPKMVMGGTREERFDHPAQKPVVLYDIPILNHAGDVYDPFAGCGTSLIAAEQQSRRLFGVEVEPRYVHVAIQRWEAFTGQTAVRVDG